MSGSCLGRYSQRTTVPLSRSKPSRPSKPPLSGAPWPWPPDTCTPTPHQTEVVFPFPSDPTKQLLGCLLSLQATPAGSALSTDQCGDRETGHQETTRQGDKERHPTQLQISTCLLSTSSLQDSVEDGPIFRRYVLLLAPHIPRSSPVSPTALLLLCCCSAHLCICASLHLRVFSAFLHLAFCTCNYHSRPPLP